MSIGTQVITRSQFEAEIRKLKLSMSGAGNTPTDVDAVENFIELADVPQTYAGATGELPNVNAAEDGLEFNPYVTVNPTTPILTIRNMTDAEVDPIIQFAVGATPIIKFTMGVDDSDDDKWKLAVGDEFGNAHDTIVVSSAGGMAGVVEFTLIDTFATAVKMRGVCTDGIYIYCVSGEFGNTKIYKYDITDGTLLDTSLDTNGAANGGRCVTDGTHVYVLCTSYVKKYLCTDLSYVASSDSWSFVGYTGGIYYWAGHFYISNVVDGNIRKIRCSDMGTVWTTTFTQGAGTNQTNTARGVATDGQFVYIQDCETNNRIIRLNMDGTWYDATDVVKPLDFLYFAPWCAGDYLYDMAEYVANDYYVEKRNKSDLSISETFNVLNYVTQGCRWGDYHYLVSIESTGIYKYRYTTSGSSAPAKIWFRLKDVYGQFVDIATLTADIRLGVGTTIPSETIEAVGNIKAQAGQFISTKATGTAPHVVSSTTVCTNLNAGLVDGYHHDQSLLTTAGPTFDHLHLTTDLPVSEGGTGTSTFMDGGLLVGAAANPIEALAVGLTTQILVGGGAGTNPAWGTDIPTAVTIGSAYIYRASGTDVPVADGGTGKSSFTQYAIPYASAATTIGEIAIGAAGKVLAVNGTANGYEWIAAGGGGTFLTLTDVDEPNYTGHAGHFVVVDGDEDALVFSASSVAAHDILSVTHGDTLASAVSVGSMIFGNATPKWAELNAGTEGQILEMGATLPGWGRTITISDSAASGGSNGDIWLEY